MLNKPKKGTTCPALIDESYSMRLFDDNNKFCKCAVTGKRCLGAIIIENGSSQFFMRGENRIDTNKIKKCPMYGLSKEALEVIVKDRASQEANERIAKMK